MGVVKHETKHYFPQGHIWVLWDAGEENEYGYEIDVPGEDGEGGELHTVLNWSFGHETWSKHIWHEWGEYVSNRFKRIEGDKEALQLLTRELSEIECVYAANQPEDIYKPNHLKDLDKITELIKENNPN